MKSGIKSLENRPLTPWTPESLNPLLRLNWRRTRIINSPTMGRRCWILDKWDKPTKKWILKRLLIKKGKAVLGLPYMLGLLHNAVVFPVFCHPFVKVISTVEKMHVHPRSHFICALPFCSFNISIGKDLKQGGQSTNYTNNIESIHFLSPSERQ